MKLKTVVIAVLSLFASGLLAAPIAAPGWQPRPAQSEPAAQASALVRGGMQALLQFLQSDTAPDEAQLAAFLQENVANRFDFDRMAALVVGRGYYAVSQQRREQMAQYLQQDFLQVLGAKLSGFQQQSVRFFRPRPRGRDQAVVTVGIANPNGYTARLDFYLHRVGNGWKVYDVAANGNSAIAYYRQKFAAAVRAPYAR